MLATDAMRDTDWNLQRRYQDTELRYPENKVYFLYFCLLQR